VAGFLGAPKMNFIPCTAVAGDADKVSVRLPSATVIDIAAHGGAVAAGDKLTLGVRAEHLGLHADDSRENLVDAKVSHVEYLGDVAIVYASVEGVPDMLAVKQPAEGALLQAGNAMRLYLPPRHCLLFDAEGKALPRTV